MIEKSYEFDPCTLDDDQEDTLDNWCPTKPGEEVFRKASEWRQKQNDSSLKDRVSPDDLRKIHTYLLNKVSDSDIMATFNLTPKSLVAIKKNKFTTCEGVVDDDLERLALRHENLHRKFNGLLSNFELIERTLMSSPVFLDALQVTKNIMAIEAEKKKEKRYSQKKESAKKTKDKKESSHVKIQDIN